MVSLAGLWACQNRQLFESLWRTVLPERFNRSVLRREHRRDLRDRSVGGVRDRHPARREYRRDDRIRYGYRHRRRAGGTDYDPRRSPHHVTARSWSAVWRLNASGSRDRVGVPKEAALSMSCGQNLWP